MGRNYKGRDAQIDLRRTHVAALLVTMPRATVRRVRDALAGLPEPISVGKSTVARDIEMVKDEWREHRQADIDEWVERELAEIEQVKIEAWVAYRKSKKVRGKVQTKLEPKYDEAGKPDGQRVVETVNTKEEQTGNPKYLETILRCAEQRAKLLGLYGHETDFGGPRAIVLTVDIGDNVPIDMGKYPPLEDDIDYGYPALPAGEEGEPESDA